MRANHCEDSHRTPLMHVKPSAIQGSNCGTGSEVFAGIALMPAHNDALTEKHGVPIGQMRRAGGMYAWMRSRCMRNPLALKQEAN